MLTKQNIKDINNLRDKSKYRKETGLFLVEGIRMFSEVPKEKVERVIVTQNFLNENKDLLQSFEYDVVDDNLFAKLSDTKTPQGIMCVVKQMDYSLESMLTKKDKSLFVVLEDIQDPGNLGTIFRTSEGAEVSGIIMSKGCVDIYNPKTIRSTMGSIYRVPFIYTDDLHGAINILQSNGVKVYAAHLKGEAYYDEIKYGATAFLIGNEGNGLKEETANKADTYIKIPMGGKLESLNAAVATSILIYEHNRQLRNG